MKIWKGMVLYRLNALKSSHFSHSKCYKNHVYEGNYLKLGTYILLEFLLVHIFRFFENFEIWVDFVKNIKKMLKNIKIPKILKISQI